MTDTIESLTAQVKTLKDAKASPADIKVVNDKLVALKKAAGQAKKKAEAKPDEDEDGAAPPAKTEAKAETPKVEAAKPSEAVKPETAKGTKKGGAKPEAGAKKADEPAKLETPKADERKKSEKTEPRKKSEKGEEPSPKKDVTAADRKKSEKVAERAAATAEDPVDALSAKVSELNVAKPKKGGAARPAEGAAAGETPKSAEPTKVEAAKGAKKGGKPTTPVTPDDPPKAAEPVKIADIPAAVTSPAETGKKAAAKKTSERKQSTKAEESPKPESKTEGPVRIHAASGSKQIRILAISGSLRKDSFNTALLRAAQKAAPSNVEIVIADISGLPFFNQDTEFEPNPAVKKFKDEIAAADAILFATPEFNYSLPGVLKNAIDVASRPYGHNAWANKLTGIWSASVGGFGGLRAQLTLRQSAVFLKLNIYPGDEFLVSDATKKFDANGLPDDATREKLENWLGAFSTWVRES